MALVASLPLPNTLTGQEHDANNVFRLHGSGNVARTSWPTTTMAHCPEVIRNKSYPRAPLANVTSKAAITSAAQGRSYGE
jgi:hypothetical protein